MANSINHPRYPEACIRMSNGRTDVVYATFIVSLSKLAQTERDFDFYFWLADHDQSVLGFGTVGIDLDEMPWSIENFEQEKQFLLKVVEDAWENLGHKKFDFGTHPEDLRGDFENIRMLTLHLTAEDVENAPNKPFYQPREIEKPDSLELCREHGIYKTIYGCYICNNWS